MWLRTGSKDMALGLGPSMARGPGEACGLLTSGRGGAREGMPCPHEEDKESDTNLLLLFSSPTVCPVRIPTVA